MRRLSVVGGVALGLLAGGVPAFAHPHSPAGEPCFGAAARDPEHQPCVNPSLRYSVVPTPGDALLLPGSPCTPVRSRKPPEVCSFGAPARGAAGDVALVGDSHAAHWRAALDVVARAERWHALTVYRSACPFSLSIPPLPEPARAQCMAWTRQVLAWFGRHPEVGTVFVSANSTSGAIPAPGQDELAAEVAGYVAAWQALPATVRRIVVLSDVPHNELGTYSCLERTIARHRPTASACRIARAEALRPDPIAAAAAQARSPRVAAVDLTPFMCDARWCFPVVGGALVHKDIGHLTRVFSATLGPYLLRAVRALDRPALRPRRSDAS